MASALDDSIGNITRLLDARGMLNNTVIAFTTDNGGPANGFDMNAASNTPLRSVMFITNKWLQINGHWLRCVLYSMRLNAIKRAYHKGVN